MDNDVLTPEGFKYFFELWRPWNWIVLQSGRQEKMLLGDAWVRISIPQQLCDSATYDVVTVVRTFK